MPFKGKPLFQAALYTLIKDVFGGKSKHLPQQKNPRPQVEKIILPFEEEKKYSQASTSYAKPGATKTDTLYPPNWQTSFLSARMDAPTFQNGVDVS